MLFTGLRTAPAAWARRSSSFATNLGATQVIDPEQARIILARKNVDPEELQTLRALLRSPSPPEVTNEILRHGLRHDFSLYYATAPDHPWSDSALCSLVEHNPGRAYSLENLVNRHARGQLSTKIRLLLAKKLLLGEISDQADGSYIAGERNIRKAIETINGCSASESLHYIFQDLFGAALALDCLHLLAELDVAESGEWLAQHALEGRSEELDDAQYLQVAEIVFKTAPQLLSKRDYSRVLSLVEPSTSFADDALQYVEQMQMDVDKSDADALVVRLQLIETYGINTDNLDKMLEKFHMYQSKEKFGIEYVQMAVVKAFCYQSLKNSDPVQLKIAETLVLPEGIPVSTIAELVLSNSQYSVEKALEVYNKYIQLVSGTLNDVTKRSPKGILTEVLVISSLYNNDRPFAELAYQKAIETKTISNEGEIALIKKVFKAYGDAFVEDSWEAARPVFKEFVLARLKRLGKIRV